MPAEPARQAIRRRGPRECAPPSAGVEPITVIIADDDSGYREALAAVIDNEPGLKLVGVARSSPEAIALARELQPDVVLADVRMGGGGASVARELSRDDVRSRVIALSAYDDHARVMQMFDAGASGYLLKGSTVEALVEGIIEAARGLRALDTRAAPTPDPSTRRAPVAGRRSRPDAAGIVVEPLRVLVVDDDHELLSEMVATIDGQAGFVVVASAMNARDAVDMAVLHQPHVALVEWRIPEGGIDIISEIRDRCPAARVIGISVLHHPQIAMAVLRAGASGFLAKPISPDELMASLRNAANGQLSITPELSGPVLEQLIDDLQNRVRAADDRALMRERIQSIMRGPLSMAYQPIVALADNAPVAVEALARFTAEPRQMANVWFREAAHCGLIVDLDMVTMTKALEALEWLPREVSLHINLAPETLFAGRATELLELLEPERVVVEITEHSDIEDYGQLNRALAPMRARGVKLAVDDVGAGFSSLRHVLVLEPDMIKLDVSLCRGIDSNDVRRALARALTAFGQEVDKMVVAEGVETESELAALIELGVTHAQGYLLGRPDLNPSFH